MQQRASLCRALIHEPQLLMLTASLARSCLRRMTGWAHLIGHQADDRHFD
jgi:ABC-type molybdenum transport system ATPase subunit/photorepair protein PhrA